MKIKDLDSNGSDYSFEIKIKKLKKDKFQDNKKKNKPTRNNEK